MSTFRLYPAIITALVLTVPGEAVWAQASQPRQGSTAEHPVIPGPQATQQLFDEIAAEDRRLFDRLYPLRCNGPSGFAFAALSVRCRRT